MINRLLRLICVFVIGVPLMILAVPVIPLWFAYNFGKIVVFNDVADWTPFDPVFGLVEWSTEA